ncbi:MAG: class I SAM-dependent methyltransferase [Acidobacteriota bacterium]|nr:class I SAM-dependent methyltransferase [Acidobacteriota bacterium]
MSHYDYPAYCAMLADERRLKPYSEALRKVVSDESVVLDLGSGTGFFSFLAVRYGARKVYAVETNPLIGLSKTLASANLVDEKIEFIKESSTSIELSEKADILVSDLHGTLPFYGKSPASIIDARERLLKPDAHMIPEREKVFFALANFEEFYREKIGDNLGNFGGFDFSSAHHLITDRLLNAYKEDLELYSAPRLFAELDYRTLTDTEFEADLSFEVERDGIINGLRAWFEADLDDEYALSNSPDFPDMVYGAPVLPFPKPVSVSKGDRVDCKISVFEKNEGYSMNWDTSIFDQTGKNSQRFHQSMLRAVFVPPDEILKQSEYFMPRPTIENEIDLFVLKRFDSETPIGDIADYLLEAYPASFQEFEKAFERVISVVQKYGY